jgi:DNA-binding transcriptional LysR family regulator
VARHNEGMEIRELRAFIAAVEVGGLSAAARGLHLSQSALSQTVQALERELGVTLLVRSHAGVRATPAGETLLAEARALVARHDQAVALVTAGADAGDAAIAGLIRIGIPLELPGDLLPGVLAELNLAYPDTRVEVQHLRSRAQIAALTAGDLDVALVRDRPADPELDAVLVVEEAMGVLLSSDRAVELGTVAGVRLDRLAGLDWVGFAQADTPVWWDQVAATLRGHGLSVSAQGYGDTVVTAEVKLAAVRTGRAFALASPSWPLPLPEGVSWLPLTGSPIVRRTWAVWSSRARHRDLAALIGALWSRSERGGPEKPPGGRVNGADLPHE